MAITSILPDDVIEEILVRLSVKHLLQLKCVCKHWYALIRDYAFHKKHYRYQYARHDVIPLFLVDIPMFSDPAKPKSYLLSKHEDVDVVLNMTHDFERDSTPLFANDPELPTMDLQCLGIVNGVVLLQWGYRFFQVDRSRVALWNPATRDVKNLPRWPVVPDNEAAKAMDAEIIALGFDIQSDDFKILGKIYQKVNDGYDCISEYHLYSLKANSWKKLQGAPSSFLSLRRSCIDAFLDNGIYYWYSDARWIVSFNFSTETFKEFELAESVWGSANQHMMISSMEIGKYKERLALFATTHTVNNTDVNFEMWTTATNFCDDDLGVPSSWQPVLRVGPIESINRSVVKAVRACGDLLLYIGNDFWEKEGGYLYDPSTCTFSSLELDFCASFSYVESLFSLSGIF